MKATTQDIKAMVTISCFDCKKVTASYESAEVPIGQMSRNLRDMAGNDGWGDMGDDLWSCPRCMGYPLLMRYTPSAPISRGIRGTFTHWVDRVYEAIYRGISRIYEEGDMGTSLWGMVGVLFGVLLMLGTKDQIDNWDILASGIVGGWFATFILGAYRAVRRL